jgi:hypothetical protein
MNEADGLLTKYKAKMSNIQERISVLMDSGEFENANNLRDELAQSKALYDAQFQANKDLASKQAQDRAAEKAAEKKR